MRDTHLYEMEKAKVKYISEHKDQSAVNLKKFFNPQTKEFTSKQEYDTKKLASLCGILYLQLSAGLFLNA